MSNEGFYLIVGIILGALMSALSSIFTGWWQYRVMIDQAKKNRELEIEKINQEKKLQKLSDKIGECYLKRNYYLKKGDLLNWIQEMQSKVKEKSLTDEDKSKISSLLYRYKIIEGRYHEVWRQFTNSPGQEQIDYLAKYLSIRMKEIDDNIDEKLQNMNFGGWSLLIKNRDAVKKINDLSYYFENLSEERSLYHKKEYKEKVDKSIKEICELLRTEIHLE